MFSASSVINKDLFHARRKFRNCKKSDGAKEEKILANKPTGISLTVDNQEVEKKC